MRVIPLSLAAACFSLAACSHCKPGPSGLQTVALRAQESSLWCWAASGQMVMETLHHGVNQCTQVNDKLSRSDCSCTQCSGGLSDGACDVTGWPDFSRYGFSASHTSDAPLSWDELKQQVASEPSCKNRPFAFTWHYDDGGGHMMVANGYQEVGGERYVSVVNPWGPCSGDVTIMTYDHYVAAAGEHTHWDDYYDIEYRGTGR